MSNPPILNPGPKTETVYVEVTGPNGRRYLELKTDFSLPENCGILGKFQTTVLNDLPDGILAPTNWQRLTETARNTINISAALANVSIPENPMVFAVPQK